MQLLLDLFPAYPVNLCNSKHVSKIKIKCVAVLCFWAASVGHELLKKVQDLRITGLDLGPPELCGAISIKLVSGQLSSCTLALYNEKKKNTHRPPPVMTRQKQARERQFPRLKMDREMASNWLAIKWTGKISSAVVTWPWAPPELSGVDYFQRSPSKFCFCSSFRENINKVILYNFMFALYITFFLLFYRIVPESTEPQGFSEKGRAGTGRSYALLVNSCAVIWRKRPL